MLGGSDVPRARVRTTPLMLERIESALVSPAHTTETGQYQACTGVSRRDVSGDPATAETIAQRAASLAAVPDTILSGFDRAFLLHWVRRAYTVYAYQAPSGRWNLWFESWRLPLPLPPHLALPAPADDR